MSHLRIETLDGYAIIALAKKPVNSLNTEVWEQLKEAFDKLEQNKSIRGVIFTSGLDRPVFTAGVSHCCIKVSDGFLWYLSSLNAVP